MSDKNSIKNNLWALRNGNFCHLRNGWVTCQIYLSKKGIVVVISSAHNSSGNILRWKCEEKNFESKFFFQVIKFHFWKLPSALNGFLCFSTPTVVSHNKKIYNYSFRFRAMLWWLFCVCVGDMMNNMMLTIIQKFNEEFCLMCHIECTIIPYSARIFYCEFFLIASFHTYTISSLHIGCHTI